MTVKILTKTFTIPNFRKPVAIVGSPGLRSIGKVAVNLLVKELKAKLIAEMYTSNFPILYDTKPSYTSIPGFSGIVGGKVKRGKLRLPTVRFYFTNEPELVIVKGYHANFEGQYYVAEKVARSLLKFNVRRIYILAGYAVDGPDVCCAATDEKLIDEMKKFNLNIGYQGPFMGFSGLVFGMGKIFNIEGICLFGRTKPNPDNPQYPDPPAAKAVLSKLDEILSLNIFRD